MTNKKQLIAQVEDLLPGLGTPVDFKYLPNPRKKGEQPGPYWLEHQARAVRHMQEHLPKVEVRVNGTTYRIIADQRAAEAFLKRVKKVHARAFESHTQPTTANP